MNESGKKSNKRNLEEAIRAFDDPKDRKGSSGDMEVGGRKWQMDRFIRKNMRVENMDECGSYNLQV